MSTTIAVTELGALLIMAGLLLLWFRPPWLLALLVVSSVLQAPAVITVAFGVERHGVTPFNMVTLLLGVHLIPAWMNYRKRRDGGSGQRSLLFAAWAIFLAYSVLGAISLPIIFDGVPVHPLLKKSDIESVAVPNHFSISHVAQAVNGLGLLVILAYVYVLAEPKRSLKIITCGFVGAFAISLLLGAYQRGSIIGLFSLDLEFWASNPTYNQSFHDPLHGPYFGRAALPFIEPSYASVWFSSCAAAAFAAAVYTRSRYWPRWLLLATAATAGLANTVGTTGFAALGLFVLSLIAYHWCYGRQRSTRRTNLILGVTAAGVAGGALFVTVDYLQLRLGWMEPVRATLGFTLAKIEALPESPRAWSTARAFAIVAETYGLGVGAGSTRASSYVVSLLANTGVVGFALFVYALIQLLKAAVPPRSTLDIAIVAAIITCCIGVFSGIPDQSWPVFWMFILLGIAAVSARGAGFSLGAGRAGADDGAARLPDG